MTKATHRSRRRFLERSLCCALLGSGAGAISGKLSLVGSALAASGDYASLGDYRTLVCVFLYGGSDSFNLFVPLEAGRYEAYAAARGAIALERERLVASGDGRIGFHPDMPRLAARYDAGDVAVVGNVGNLVRPITRADYLAGSGAIPVDLFAHNHQQEQWLKGLASRPQALVGTGWGGRMADMLADANAGGVLPPTFSLTGSNHFLPGNRTTPVAVDPLYGPRQMSWMDSDRSFSNTAREAAMARILALQDDHRLRRFAGRAYGRALESSRALVDVLAANPASSRDFSTYGNLGIQLKMAARLIAGRESLGMRRQILFVGMGGWDTHDTQSPRLARLAHDLDKALATFQDELDGQGVADSVTTFTASDFGRTLTVNGDGSDHGWGGHYLVMGGAVNGGRFVGDWPSYEIDGADDSGDKGRVIPTMSVNEYGAALASWMGLSDGDVLDVFPDLARFGDGWRSQHGLFGAA